MEDLNNKNDIFLSIIIPVYNTSKYLGQCLDSILDNYDQSITEIIIINDCSTDNSQDIIDYYKSIYPKLIVLSNNHNMGLSETRNIGISYSIGDYILFIDSDDLLIMSEVYRLLNFTITNDIDVLEFQYIRFNNSVNLILDNNVPEIIQGIDYSDGKLAMSSLLSMNKFDTVACNKIYKSQLLKESGLSFIRNRYHEDIDWTPKVFAIAKKVFISKNVAYFYRNTINSITNTTDIDYLIKRQKDIIEIAKMNLYHFRHESTNLRNQIYDWYSRSIMFAATLNPPTFKETRLLPLIYSRKITTIIKSLIFLTSITLYKVLKDYKI